MLRDKLGMGTAKECETYSETFETADIAQYYEAYVQGTVYQNGTQVNSGYSQGYPYSNDAYGTLYSPPHVPDLYEIQSDHYLVAYYTYYDPSTGTTYYGHCDFQSDSERRPRSLMPRCTRCGIRRSRAAAHPRILHKIQRNIYCPRQHLHIDPSPARVRELGLRQRCD